MPPFRQSDIFRPCANKQRGVALMVMLVIMIIGAATLLVSSLSSSAIIIERDKTTANALAQAKEALIGRAVADDNRPGSLPCPDTNDDGSSEFLSGDDCPSYTGRLPWRTLGLPDLRDGAGERLWYALSRNFRDDNSSHINSDTQGTLTIGGTNPASNVIAIIFAPGQVLNGTSRSPSITAACSSLGGANKAQSLCATNYLEGNNAAVSTWATPNLNYQSADTSSTFNDRMIFITHKNLMPLIEKRIAREASSCLENYASTYFNKYPWAAPISDTSNYFSTTNTLFGRLPTSPNPSSVVKQLLDFLAALQTALTNYNLSNNYSDQTYIDALMTAGADLADYASTQTPASAAPLDQTSLDLAYIAGTFVKAPEPQTTWTNNQAAEFVKALQNRINRTSNDFDSKNHGNLGQTIFVIGWPSCKLFSTSNAYWTDWKNLVFYQIADGYAADVYATIPPISSCTAPNNTMLTINGAGSYQAAVIVAGEKLTGQTRTSAADIQAPSNYLANSASEIDLTNVINAHTGACPANNFITYKPTDSNYQTVNDLVLCLDGSTNCK